MSPQFNPPQTMIPALNRCASIRISAVVTSLVVLQVARRLAAELQRREADLLQRQLEQQRHLLTRLDSPGLRPAERQTLLAALRALQAASVSTQAGLAAALERDGGGAGPRSARTPQGHTTVPQTQRGAVRRAYPTDGRETTLTDQPAAKLARRTGAGGRWAPEVLV